MISESLGEIIPSMIPYKKSYVLSEKGVSIHWSGEVGGRKEEKE